MNKILPLYILNAGESIVAWYTKISKFIIKDESLSK